MNVSNSHLHSSDNFQRSKILFQTCHFRRQRFGQEFGIDLFGDISTSMTEQTTDNRHGKSFVQCKDRKRMPGRVHRETERKADLFTDNGQRLVDAFRGIVAGLVKRLRIVEIQIILY